VVEELIFEFARAESASDPFAFRFVPQTYLLRTAGGGFETAELPWTPELLADLAALQKPGCDRLVVQRVGELLRRFMAPLGFAQHEARILAHSRAGQPIVLTFRFAAAELYALPWELLTDKASGQYLGGLPGVLIRYEWPETRTTPPMQQPPPEGGRILFAWSAAGGAVPAREQLAAIRAGCADGFVPFVDERDTVANASCQSLVAALERARSTSEPIAVLHLLCHGGATGSTFGLVLQGEDVSEAVVVDAGTLRQLLAPFSDMVRLVVLSACDSGNVGPLGSQLGSVAQALHRAGFAQVLASRYPLAVTAANKLTQTLYHGLLGETQSLEQSLLAVRSRLLRDPQLLDWASLQLYARSEQGTDSRPLTFRPYRGLLAFQPQHSRFFFGRDREVSEIKTALAQLKQAQKPRFLIVAGASGSGKSSVVLAGALPQLLAAEEGLSPLVIRPGSEPQQALQQVLPESESETPSQKPPRPILLVVDQLEEIFTHVSDPALRTAFVQRLWQLAQRPHIQIIATLRVDFIGECGDLVLDPAGLRLDRVAYDPAHRVFVAQLEPAQLREIIEGPAQRVGMVLEPGLTGRLLEAVGNEPGALPLLQHTLDQLWLRREGRTLSQAGYDALGQLTGALARHADALILRLSDQEQQSARSLLVRLVHLGDGVVRSTRQRVPVDRLRPKDPPSAARFAMVLREATNARLLVCAGEEPHETVEVAHEALIRSWPRLTEWLQKDRAMLADLEKLEALLAQWRQHHALLSGEQLHLAEQIARDYPEHFPEEARQLLRQSQREAAKIRLLKRGAVLATVVAMVVFAVQYFVEQRARRQAETARQQVMQLLSQNSRTPSPAELLRTLARLHLETELRPDLALHVIAQALLLEPHNGNLLVDQTEYLLAAGRLDAVLTSAHAALERQIAPTLRVHSALWGWTAARLTQPEPVQKQWRERLRAEYHQLPPGVAMEARAAMTQLLLQNQHQLVLADVLAAFAIVLGEKTPAKESELTKRLQ
jgi:hypothetical protein